MQVDTVCRLLKHIPGEGNRSRKTVKRTDFDDRRVGRGGKPRWDSKSEENSTLKMCPGGILKDWENAGLRKEDAGWEYSPAKKSEVEVGGAVFT